MVAQVGNKANPSLRNLWTAFKLAHKTLLKFLGSGQKTWEMNLGSGLPGQKWPEFLL